MRNAGLVALCFLAGLLGGVVGSNLTAKAPRAGVEYAVSSGPAMTLIANTANTTAAPPGSAGKSNNPVIDAVSAWGRRSSTSIRS